MLIVIVIIIVVIIIVITIIVSRVGQSVFHGVLKVQCRPVNQ